MPDHTMNELAALSGLSVRTIRYYQSQGLVPSVGREGPGTRYPESTLARLLLVVRMKRDHLPLGEIRNRLAELGDEEIALLAAEAEPEQAPGSALDYVRALLAQGSTTPEAATDAAAGVVPRPGYRAQRVGSDVAPPLPGTGLWSMVPPSEAPPAPGPDALRASPGKPSARAAPKPKPRTLERSTWDRIGLGPDIEIHVRRPLSRRDNRMVERIVTFAREVLEGEEG